MLTPPSGVRIWLVAGVTGAVIMSPSLNCFGDWMPPWPRSWQTAPSSTRSYRTSSAGNPLNCLLGA